MTPHYCSFFFLHFFVDCLRGTLVSGNASVLVSSETATPKLPNEKQHACRRKQGIGRCGIRRLVEQFASELVQSDGRLGGGAQCWEMNMSASCQCDSQPGCTPCVIQSRVQPVLATGIVLRQVILDRTRLAFGLHVQRSGGAW